MAKNNRKIKKANHGKRPGSAKTARIQKQKRRRIHT